MKVRSELRAEVLNNLRRKTGININEEGSIAVAIVDSLIDEMMLLYRELERIQGQAYLSTSTGNYTELIGDLVDTDRRAGESDTEYKLRIANSIYSVAKGNTLSIQEAIWSVAGVASFDIQRYTKGTGSFTIYVYPQRNANQTYIIDKVRAAVSQVVAEGIRFEVKVPEETRVDLSIIVQFDTTLSVIQKQNIRNEIRTKLVNYINNTTNGSNIYINEIIEQVMSTNTHILDLSINAIKINNKNVNVGNLFGEKDITFVAGTIDIV